ncbi:MAG: BamA/TamA family outer membrane protein [Bacteroidota bacterium]
MPATTYFFFALKLMCFALCLWGECIVGQSPSPLTHRVFFFGNLADLNDPQPFLEELTAEIESSPTRFTLILNGDLIRQSGYPFVKQKDSARLYRVLKKISSYKNGRTILLPGDRDWASSGPKGWESVRRLEKLVKSWDFSRVKWAIKKGCPGPKVISLSKHLDLLCLQTQWWNHQFEKPRPENALCKVSTEADFWEETEDAIRESAGKSVLIAGHYGPVSLGPRGGRIPAKTHLFPLTDLHPGLWVPLPVLGTLYASFRQNSGTPTDIINPRFEDFAEDFLGDILLTNSSLVYLSGHEASQQVLKVGESYILNSGAPAKTAFSGPGKNALLSESKTGFMEIRYHEKGEIFNRTHFLSKNNKNHTPYQELFLFQSPCALLDTLIPPNLLFGFCGEASEEASGDELFDEPIQKAAGEEYEGGSVKKLFFGNDYRPSWLAPVNTHFLNLDTIAGGLQFVKRGGGTQTRSLRFIGANKKEYTFRSINKDPVKRLNFDLRQTIIGYILRDQTSAQQPYGSLVASRLMKGLCIPHSPPRLGVMPLDSRLGIYQFGFANVFGTLEENPKSLDTFHSGFGDVEEVRRTHKLFSKLYRNPRATVDQRSFAKARLFDIWTGDWSRHEDNWKWAEYEENGLLVYRPIPRDRDMVFSRYDGIIPWIADRRWVKPQGENFGYRINDLMSLTWTGMHLDRILLNELNSNDWLKLARDFQARCSDSLIEAAVRVLPGNVYQLCGQEITSKLKTRRDDLDMYALRFYKLLAKEVDIIGTQKSDFVEVERNPDGDVEVWMYNVSDSVLNEHGTFKYYYRRFLPNETREIRIYGMAGEDQFRVTGNTDNSIKLRLIGGPGRDVYQEDSKIQGTGKYSLVYDNDVDGEYYLGTSGRRVNPRYAPAYRFGRKTYEHDMWYPLPLLGFSRDDGTIFSMGFLYVDKGYGKPDFRSRHKFRATLATSGSYGFRYKGEFRHLIKKWDGVISGEIAAPTRYFYFFGFGNETENIDSLFTADFYRSRYNTQVYEAYLMRRMWKRSHFAVGVHYENNEAQIQENTLLFSDTRFLGQDQVNMLEVFGRLDLDFRDNRYFPTKGMRLVLEHRNGVATNIFDRNYGLSDGFISYFTTFRTGLPLTLLLRAGGSSSYGPLPFYRHFSLGHGNRLRGFFRNRFTGNARAYFNSELSLQVANLQGISVPVRIGIKGFFDTGRIIQRGETSTRWHYGYGGGFYIIPYKEFLTLTVSAAFSQEESLYLRFGLGVPFR